MPKPKSQTVRITVTHIWGTRGSLAVTLRYGLQERTLAGNPANFDEGVEIGKVAAIKRGFTHFTAVGMMGDGREPRIIKRTKLEQPT